MRESPKQIQDPPAGCEQCCSPRTLCLRICDEQGVVQEHSCCELCPHILAAPKRGAAMSHAQQNRQRPSRTEMQLQLQQALQEERYEDAAMLRDAILDVDSQDS